MNTYDSQLAAGILTQAGFEVVSESEDTEERQDMQERPWLSQGADIVLMNTCSVREHAEDRVYGRLGMLGKEKKIRSELIIGLMGCMVEEHREKLFKRFPYLDLMIGTRNIQELPELIRQVQKTRRQAARIKQEGLSIEYSEFIRREKGFHAWLPIMTGCNKVCTFCIVPKTRGHEVSMPARQVCQEAQRLVEDGVKWITLLGQNVNSYEGQGVSFPQLLEMLCGIKGLERISFTTSHPQDATEALFEVIAKHSKIHKRFHLPLQSGSDRILKRMKRLHTYAEYKEKIAQLRAWVPGVSITTDIIVGFSGEKEEDHAATRHALQELRFDGAFIYKYSLRPGTPAAKLKDDVPALAKTKRHHELLTLQKKITAENNRERLGRIQTVFIEAMNPRNQAELLGRSDQDQKVVFKGDQKWLGRFASVELTQLCNETFKGKMIRLLEP